MTIAIEPIILPVYLLLNSLASPILPQYPFIRFSLAVTIPKVFSLTFCITLPYMTLWVMRIWLIVSWSLRSYPWRAIFLNCEEEWVAFDLKAHRTDE